MIELLKQRRSNYNLEKNIPISDDELKKLIVDITSLVPDAFNMQSARVVTLLDKSHEDFWDIVYDSFGGKVTEEKLAPFKKAKGTILYFIDEDVVNKMANEFPSYSENFPIWANHANAMLQFAMWTALREKNIGASLQHYNPVIDENVKTKFNIPANFKLIAEMPFGGIVKEAPFKEKNGEKRVEFK